MNALELYAIFGSSGRSCQCDHRGPPLAMALMGIHE